MLLISLDSLHREHFHLLSISIDSKPRRFNGQRGGRILHQEKKWKRKKRKLLSVVFEKLKTYPTQNVSQSVSEGFTSSDRVETLSERRGRDPSQRRAERRGSQNSQSGKVPLTRIPDRRLDVMCEE